MPTKGSKLEIPDVSLPEFWSGRFFGRENQVAIVDCTKSGAELTYGEIYNQSRNVAAFLHQNGAKPKEAIAICSFSPVEFVVAMLGVMECGAIMAPCNPNYKKGEILQLFTISEPKMVFVDDSSLETMKAVKAELPCLEKIFVIGKSDEFPTLETMIIFNGDMGFLKNVKIRPEDTVALPYSSGTTGLQKCVMLKHKNIVATSLILAQDLNWCDGRVGYLDRPMDNIAGFETALAMLNSGMKVIVGNDFQVNRALEVIAEYKVTHMMTVTSVVIEIANTEGIEKYDTSALMEIYFGGDVAAPDIVRRLAKIFNVAMRSGITNA